MARLFLARVPFFLFSVVAVSFSWGDIKSVVARKPNVLMIVVDDMNDFVGCMGGNPDTHTPNIDKLASRGMLFSNAHCAAPVCNASRVATLTGLRPGITGIYDNRARWHEIFPGLNSIPQHFKAHGYRVVGGGKVYHHMPGFNRLTDWDEYFPQVFDGHYQHQLHSGLPVKDFRFPEGYPLNNLPSVKAMNKPPKNPREFDWGPIQKADAETGDGQMIQWAIDFLSRPHEQPFFLAAGIYRPHLPFYATQQYFDLYRPDTLKLPKLNDQDLNDLPPAGLKYASQRREDFELVMNSGKYRELLHAYLASISFADAQIGRLIDTLDASGEADNTIIVFWSDHGWHFGEKEHLHKMTLWERSTRIPFILVDPRTTRPETRCEQPVGMVDLFPTLNELCELPNVEGLSGQSLKPLLKNPEQEWERPALITSNQGDHAIRSKRWRYIRYADGGEELYDHQNDPHEWHNVADEPSNQQIKSKLARWLPTTSAKPLGKNSKPQSAR